MKTKVFIDFETRSFANIKKVGAYRYVSDKTTEALCMVYAVEDRQTVLWTRHSVQKPVELLNLVAAGAEVHGWNIKFDQLVWNTLMSPKYGWPNLSNEQCFDVMAQAANMSLPLSLETCGETLLPKGLRKSSSGRYLITKLCKPHKGAFRTFDKFTEDYMDLYSYCSQDVETTRGIHNLIPQLTPKERDVYLQCQSMNDRGVPVDTFEIGAIMDCVDKEKGRLNSKLPFLTGGDVVAATQTKAISGWLSKETGTNVDSIAKDKVAALLKTYGKNKLIKEVLRIRQQNSLSSIAKLNKARASQVDGLIKGGLVYHGANTGRYAGRGFQPQNLPSRVSVSNPDQVIDDFIHLPHEAMRLLYDIMPTASGLIRSVIKAPPGKKFIVADFHSIEAIAVPWVSGEVDIIESIRKGFDLYIKVASSMFNVNYHQVTKEQRQIGKVCVLAAGFSGGKVALLNMAKNYGMKMTETEAEQRIKDFRTSRYKLTLCWKSFGKAAFDAAHEDIRSKQLSKDKPFNIFPVQNCPVPIFFYRVGRDVRMKLPSGRDINYPNAQLCFSETPWGQKNLLFHCDTTLPPSGKWGQKMLTGGNLFQNAVQGICRDLLCEAQLRLEAAGYPIWLSVHDECGALVDDNDDKNLEEFISIMTESPKWAKGLPITADGYEGYRYKK